MWESLSDFQRRWKEKGNLLLVYLAFLGPSFPQPLVLMPTALPETDQRTEFASPVASVLRLPYHSLHAPFSSVSAGSRQASNSGPRWAVPGRLPTASHSENTHAPPIALGIGRDFHLSTATMEVQIVIEVLLIELLHARRMRCRDVNISHVLPNHRSVLGFHQPVVIRSARSALGVCSMSSFFSIAATF